MLKLRSLALSGALIFICTFLSQASFAAVSGENFEFSGYIRVGSGVSGKGGDMECFNNPGAAALNEFRLGNECPIYSETAFTAYHLRGENPNDPYFKTQVRFAMTPSGHSPWEAEHERLVNLFEVFMEAGNLHGLPYKYWVGKRIYRDADVYFMDWWYFADMSGNGAGIYDIPLGTGRLALAHIIQVGDKPVTSDTGRHNTQFLDARWNDVKLNDSHSLNFWLTYGFAPGGTAEDEESGEITEYIPHDGYGTGVRHRWNMEGGFNDFAIMYGKRLVESLSLWGNPAITGVSPQHNKWRLRLVDFITLQPNDQWAFHLGVGYEQRDAGCLEDGNGNCLTVNTREEWKSIGIRPVIFLSDHFQLAFEAGHSAIDYEREAKGRYLTRLTIAPQISVAPNIWGRPVLRAFVTKSFWNKALAESGAIPEAYQDETSGWNYGWHAEVWF